MAGLVLSVCTVLLGLSAHALAMRAMPLRWVLVSVPAFLLGTMVMLILLALLGDIHLALKDIFVTLVLILSIGFGYSLTLVGVIHDSPTLSIVNEIQRHGDAGMPVNTFDNFVQAHPFFESRLSALIAARELGLEQDRLVMTGRAFHLLRLGDLYRQARGSDITRTG